MNKLRLRMTGLLMALLSTYGYAEETLAPDGYRSLGDMSVEERMGMVRTTSKYNDCVFNRAIARVQEFADIRHVADIALGECEQKLNEVRDFIQNAGFDPGFADAFGNMTRNRAAQRLLPELAIRKSGG